LTEELRIEAVKVSDAVQRYHDGTKHHFHQFARSLGYLDWASQPNPFRSFEGARAFPLFPAPEARTGGDSGDPFPAIQYGRLFDPMREAWPTSSVAIGDFLRHALGLSAWKQYRAPAAPGYGDAVESRWSLRVNPSSGNLHPTEAYIVCGARPGLAGGPAVYHYAPDRHVLECRCEFEAERWAVACGKTDFVLVALSSIHWRESWKYGERAFRYCQHDLGHAIAALVVSAAMFGWRAQLLPSWSHRAIARLTGLDRDADFIDAEREEPGCLLAIGAGDPPAAIAEASPELVDAVAHGRWAGRASQLSVEHVQWTFIDEIAQATEDPGRADRPGGAGGAGRESGEGTAGRAGGACGDAEPGREASVSARAGGGTEVQLGKEWAQEAGSAGAVDVRALVLKRRSAVALDGRSSIDRASFLQMLARVVPSASAPWQALWWTPRIHFAMFIHRVTGVEPGLYLLCRHGAAAEGLRAACNREFLWERVADDVPLVCLARGDCRRLARRLSCDQDIAADGFFSLGMLAEFDASLAEHGARFYRHLFWESGFVGQLLYLQAEAAGARATGIGCFYDDPVHEVLGLSGRAYQSLYHFTVGIPVEDTRLTTAPGYGWT
jgi:SagB-type dehydrogenase family enzyme